MSEIVRIKQETFELFDSGTAVQEFDRIRGDRENMRLLLDEANGRGMQLDTGEGFAAKLGITPAEPFSPEGGVAGAPITDVTFAMYFQNLNTADDSAQGAIGTVTLTGTGDESYNESYDFSLITENHNFMDVHEYEVVDGRVVVASSWWSRVMGCLQRDCGSACIGAAISCPKVSWVAFLACLAGRCGGCVVKCAACATCNCKFWCKWAARCCEG